MDLRQTYETLATQLAKAEPEQLMAFSKYLADVQKDDWGPGGELARSIQVYVDYSIEEEK